MTVHKKNTNDDAQLTSQVQGKNPEVASGSQAKEHEPKVLEREEEKLLKEVVERSAQADRDLAEKTSEEIKKEIKIARPEINIPKDLKEHGVRAPQADASQIASNGSALVLPITESGFQAGSVSKPEGFRTKTKVIYGVPSVLAFALWAGRVLKKVHKHAKNIVFRKGAEVAGK